MPPAGHVHGRVTINFTTPLDHHVRANDLGAVYADRRSGWQRLNPSDPGKTLRHRRRDGDIGRNEGRDGDRRDAAQGAADAGGAAETPAGAARATAQKTMTIIDVTSR